MSNFNSDGYIMIDLSDVDVTKSTQNVPGIYSRILNVIDANKLILIVNHKGLTPQAAICNKLLNYYVITTNLYIYKINSNDIVIIEQAGSSSVEVSIIPTLMSGTKIADFAIGSIEGSLYAPEFESEINDNVTASNSTWSSDKIDGELALKADAADLAEVATTGSYNDLSNKPTIPTKTSDLTNDSGYITDADVPTIDDTTTSTTKVWSSDKTASELALKADATAVYTKTEVDNALSNKANSADVYTKTQVDNFLLAKQDIIKYVTGSITLEPNSYVSPFTYYKEVNLTNVLANKIIIGIVGITTTTNPITFNYNASGYLRIYGSKAEVVEYRVSYI